MRLLYFIVFVTSALQASAQISKAIDFDAIERWNSLPSESPMTHYFDDDSQFFNGIQIPNDTVAKYLSPVRNMFDREFGNWQWGEIKDYVVKSVIENEHGRFLFYFCGHQQASIMLADITDDSIYPPTLELALIGGGEEIRSYDYCNSTNEITITTTLRPLNYSRTYLMQSGFPLVGDTCLIDDLDLTAIPRLPALPRNLRADDLNAFGNGKHISALAVQNHLLSFKNCVEHDLEWFTSDSLMYKAEYIISDSIDRFLVYTCSTDRDLNILLADISGRTAYPPTLLIERLSQRSLNGEFEPLNKRQTPSIAAEWPDNIYREYYYNYDPAENAIEIIHSYSTEIGEVRDCSKYSLTPGFPFLGKKSYVLDIDNVLKGDSRVKNEAITGWGWKELNL